MSFVTDNLNFFSTTEEPAEEDEANETEEDAQGTDSTFAVIFELFRQAPNNNREGDEADEANESIVPREEERGEVRDIQQVTGHFQRSALRAADEEEEHCYADADRHEHPKSYFGN